MDITRTSLISNVVTTRDLDITPEQIAAWRSGALLEVAFPNLTPYEREFWLTGITPQEYHDAMDGDVG